MSRIRLSRLVSTAGVCLSVQIAAAAIAPIAGAQPQLQPPSQAAAPVTTAAPPAGTGFAGASWLEPYRADADRLITAATANQFAWNRLAELTDTFGPRLSGTRNLQQAIEWAVAELKKDGFENVHAEPVKVPAWVRGQESLEILEPAARPLPILGLGNSVGTAPAGVEGEVLIVDGFDALERQAAQAKGRIVVFNVPYTNYGETVRYRTAGPSRAAQYGAVATLVRSVGPIGLRTPHTGSLVYADNQPKIPAAAITVEDANALARLQQRGVKVRLRLKMDARFAPDADSANVVAELRGRELPDEVIVLGGHFDSWEPGTGASDDAAGILATWEALRLMKTLNLRPRRTIRLVFWTNEENGLRGGQAYLQKYRGDLANHVLMLESDSGVFAPISFGFTGNVRARTAVEQIAALLARAGIDHVGPAGGGADIGPAVQAGSVPSMSLNGNSERYFLIHHTPADTVDRIDPMELSQAAAAVAVMTYIVADMPSRLGQ
jgi:carboxypeptidase Q